jgi:hypothetical protein
VQALKVISTAQARLSTTGTVCCRVSIGCVICSLKFEFSFLNGNLIVPAGHQIIYLE